MKIEDLYKWNYISSCSVLKYYYMWNNAKYIICPILMLFKTSTCVTKLTALLLITELRSRDTKDERAHICCCFDVNNNKKRTTSALTFVAV
jgi:hypothetical protein